jgi:PilZ domain
MNTHFFNRRVFFRRAINEAAWIERASSNILERCTLVDLCEIGARLTISDIYDLPEKFALYVTRGSKLSRQCRVIWQRDHEVGVEFLSRAPQETAGT